MVKNLMAAFAFNVSSRWRMFWEMGVRCIIGSSPRPRLVSRMPVWTLNVLFLPWTVAFLALIPFTYLCAVLFVVFETLARAVVLFKHVHQSSRVPASTSWSPSWPQNTVLVAVQLTDTHISAPGTPPAELGEGHRTLPQVQGLLEGDELAGRLCALCKVAARLKPAVVVHTGDLTDTGSKAEFELALGAIRSGLDEKSWSHFYPVPGNHDLIFGGVHPHPKRHAEYLGLIRWAKICSMLPGFVETTKHNVIPTIEGMFPWHAKVPVDGHSIHSLVHVVGLDSCTRSSAFILTNAMGAYGKDQVERLDALVATLRGPLLVLSHHPPVSIPRGASGRFMGLIDRQCLLDVLFEYTRRDPSNNRVMVLSGHEHVGGTYVVQAKGRGVEVCVAHIPSSSLGQETGRVLDGQGYLGQVGLDCTGAWVVKHVCIGETRPVAFSKMRLPLTLVGSKGGQRIAAIYDTE